MLLDVDVSSRARRVGLLSVVVSLCACVDLQRPTVVDCLAGGGGACRSDARLTSSSDGGDAREGGTVGQTATTDGNLADGGGDDKAAVDADGDVPDAGSGDQLEPTPPDASTADGQDSAPPVTVDASPDLRPDLPPPDLPAPVDLPREVPPPDVAIDAAPVGSCAGNDPSLLVCLRFQNALSDESAPAASVTGRVVTFEGGLDGQAVRLVGASELRVAPVWGNVPGDFTLEAWIRPDRLPVGGQRAGIIDEDQHFGLFLMPQGTVLCSSSEAVVMAAGAAAVGQWTAVACRASANTLTLWINGVQRGQSQMDGIFNGATSTLGVGGNIPNGDPFDGLMDNVRVWNRALTAPQICAQSLGCP